MNPAWGVRALGLGLVVGLAGCGTTPADGGQSTVSVMDSVVLVVDGTPTHQLEDRPDGCMAVVNRSTGDDSDFLCFDLSEGVWTAPIIHVLGRVVGESRLVVKVLGDGYEFVGVRPGDPRDRVEVHRVGRWILVEQPLYGSAYTTVIVEKDGILLSCLLQALHADCGGFQP